MGSARHLNRAAYSETYMWKYQKVPGVVNAPSMALSFVPSPPANQTPSSFMDLPGGAMQGQEVPCGWAADPWAAASSSAAAATARPANSEGCVWIKEYSSVDQKYYWWNKQTRVSTWNQPSSWKPPPPEGVPPAPCASSGSFQLSSSGTVRSAEPTRGGKWQKIYSPDHGKDFYFNQDTRVSTWNNPYVEVAQQGGQPQRSPDAASSNFCESSVAPTKPSKKVQFTPPTHSEESPIWKAVDVSGKRRYWYNTRTRETTYKQPDEWVSPRQSAQFPIPSCADVAAMVVSGTDDGGKAVELELCPPNTVLGDTNLQDSCLLQEKLWHVDLENSLIVGGGTTDEWYDMDLVAKPFGPEVWI